MRFGIHYDFLTPQYTLQQTFEDAAKLLTIAEGYGFESVWAGEEHHTVVEHGHLPSPLIALSYLAASVKKMRLGTGVMLLPLYNPIQIAEQASVLDCISGGRMILGLGRGGDEIRRLGALRMSSSWMNEAVEVIGKLLAEPSVSYEGTHFRFRDVGIVPRPVQRPRPKILVGGSSETALARAAALGDGWISSSALSYSYIIDLVSGYKKALEHIGKRADEATVVLNRATIVTGERNADSEASHVLPLMRWYLELRALRGEGGKTVVSEDDPSFKDLAEFSIGGNADHCISLIERYGKIGVTHLNLRIRLPHMGNEDVLNSLKLLGEKVLPYFR